jgi:hypothetical protein
MLLIWVKSWQQNKFYQYLGGDAQMTAKLDPKQLIEFKELLMSEVIQSEALINILDRKGLISKQELLEEMKRVQAAMPKSSKG